MSTITDALNANLADERAAVIQYRAHAAMMGTAGYLAAATVARKRADEEQEHADQLMTRLRELDAAIAPALGRVDIVEDLDLPEMLVSDEAAEDRAIVAYQALVEAAVAEHDADTRALAEEILGDEVEHRRYLRAQRTQLAQMGTPNWLSLQVG